jgi:hypothetical protein
VEGEKDANAVVDLEREETEEDQDHFEPEGGQEEIESETYPGYVVEAEMRVEAEVENENGSGREREVRAEGIAEGRIIVEPEEGQQITEKERDEIPEIHLEEHAVEDVEEVSENEIEMGIQGEGGVRREAENGETIEAADDERGNDDVTSDFLM